MIPKFYIGQRVYYETEYMYAKLYPSGHTEVWETVDGEGIVTGISDYSQGFLYTIDTDDELPDGLNEIQLDGCEVQISHYDLNITLNELTEIR